MATDALHRSELEFLLLGKKLGAGSSRTVYVLNEPSLWGYHRDTNAPMQSDWRRRRSEYVIKVEQPGGAFQNAQEWSVWTWVRGTPMAKWFAPCVSISPCGLYLIQNRVQPLRDRELPKRLPAFFIDVQRDNLGLIDGQVVCCDYGTGVAAIRSSSKRLVPVKF